MTCGRGGLVEQLVGDVEVLRELHRGAVPHVRLEERLLATRDALGRQGEERPDEAVELVDRAVVGVQRDVDGVRLRHLVSERRQRGGAYDHVLHRLARGELGASPGHLHDAVALRLGEPAHRGDDGSATTCS